MRKHHTSRSSKSGRRLAGLSSGIAAAITLGTTLIGTAAPASASVPAANWRALTYAEHQIGKPYVWGGTGPWGYDCSGLTMASWRNAGVRIARIADYQFWSGRRVSFRYVKPGDLIFWSSNRRWSGIYHVGIFLRPGVMIDAPHTGARVRTDRIWPGVFPYATQP